VIGHPSGSQPQSSFQPPLLNLTFFPVTEHLATGLRSHPDADGENRATRIPQ